MAGLKIGGDLSQINTQQLKYIESVIEKRGFKDTVVTIEAVGKAGDNYIANVKRIIVDDKKGGTFKMVAKVAPTSETMRKMTSTELLFRNEHIMYTKVLPKYTQLEIAADVTPEDRLRYAACYGSSQEAPNEVILLEDLNESNFKMLDRFKPLSPECVKSVLKNFALLHSLSYVVKFKEPELFDELKNSFFDVWGSVENDKEAQSYFLQVENNTSAIVDNDVHKNAIKGAVTKLGAEAAKLAKFEKDSKYSVIQQGDSWNNNITFKFDGETFVASVMIDYQLSKPTNPAADILYMIFNCTDHQMRKEHFHDWIDYYHTELDKSLSTYGLKANFVFPRDQLDADLKRYGKISFGLSIMLASVLMLTSEDASVVKEAMHTADINEMVQGIASGAKNEETMTKVKARIEGLVKSFHEFGLL